MLVILITVAGVAIIWVGVLPMVQESFEFSELKGRVSVVMSGGYTIYDPSREVATVQVRRESDEGVMDRIKVLFLVEGNSVSSSVVAPDSGETKTYAFDLSGYGVPDGVEVAPIFILGSGREKVGSVTSSVDLGSGSIDEVNGVVYEMGVDSFGEVPTDGLVSIWTFSGDADDGWWENDGTLNGGASIVDGELVLDGVSGYVEVSEDDEFRFNSGTQDFSGCAWVNRASVGTSDFIFDKRDTSADGWVFYIRDVSFMRISVNAVYEQGASTITTGT